MVIDQPCAGRLLLSYRLNLQPSQRSRPVQTNPYAKDKFLRIAPPATFRTTSHSNAFRRLGCCNAQLHKGPLRSNLHDLHENSLVRH